MGIQSAIATENPKLVNPKSIKRKSTDVSLIDFPFSDSICKICKAKHSEVLLCQLRCEIVKFDE